MTRYSIQLKINGTKYLLWKAVQFQAERWLEQLKL